MNGAGFAEASIAGNLQMAIPGGAPRLPAPPVPAHWERHLSFNKYYQDELSFLREMGREFAQAHPEAAHFLAEGGTDPDVERLLEGFAFLTGRIRQKLDDEFPELIHALASLLMPHYLRPVPPFSLIEFQPITGMVRKAYRIAKGTEVAAVPVDGTSCRFRTCFDVDLHPFRIDSVSLQTPVGGKPELHLRFVLEQGSSVVWPEVGKLRFYLSGDPAETLYFWLRRHLVKVRITGSPGEKSATDTYFDASSVQPAGFKEQEAILPYPRNASDGYRLLQEYFTFPEKFFFVELSGLDSLRDRYKTNTFGIDFIFSRPFDRSLKVSSEHMRLYCTPVVNLVNIESEPIRIDHARTEYRLLPSGYQPHHYEIFSIDRAAGWVQGAAQEIEYLPFYSFRFGKADSDRGKAFYHARMRNAVARDGTDVYVSFVNSDQAMVLPPTETVVFQLTCTNRILAEKLRVGDIQAVTENTPAVVRFRNITRVTPGIRPPLEGDLYWRLISHLGLNSASLANAAAFRDVLELYNFPALYSRQAGKANQLRVEGIVDVQRTPEQLLFRGTPVHGMTTRVILDENHFSSEGDMTLFASILNEFLSHQVSINSFSRLIVKGSEKGEVYEWPPRIGRMTMA
jgi:type VI secretion system protein ImpG